MRHSGLVAHVGGKVTGLGRIILREGLHLATMPLGPFSRKKPQRTVTRGRKLPVRLQMAKEININCKSTVKIGKIDKRLQIAGEHDSHILTIFNAYSDGLRKEEHVVSDSLY